MRVSELPLPKNYLERLEASELNPPQAAAVKAGLLEGKNLVVASPTASGKTLIGELAIIKHLTGRGGKCLYTAPLKALASEKFDEWKAKYAELGVSVAISTGDLDSSEEWLGRYDVIITTNEKCDSLMRHKAPWLRLITLVIADEIHMMGDPGRGPTLEVVLTRLRQVSNPQVLALSATIANADEIGEWLEAKVVKSDYRPVKLYKGVFFPEEIADRGYMYSLKLDARNYKLEGGEAEGVLIADTMERGKQALIFFSTRRSAESGSEKAAKIAKRFLKVDERSELAKVAKDIENALASPTKQCRRLAAAVRMGAAFHHAGLIAKQRKAVEDSFRAGLVKVVTATPSLAMGINMPAWRVLVRDVRRFSGNVSDYIPAMEVHQMFGRAGRPKYDTEGEAILFARNDGEAEDLTKRYIKAEPEPIDSRLAAEPVLRTHVLALIATEATKSRRELLKFFEKTFLGHQYGDALAIAKKLEKVLGELEKWHFIERGEGGFISKDFVPAFALTEDSGLRATRLGKRVSELYIDPLSAAKIIQSLKRNEDVANLMAITTCGEMWPPLRLRKDEFQVYSEELAVAPLKDVPNVWDVGYQEYLEAFKTARLIMAWMDECSEETIMETFGTPPGELHNKMRSAEWLLYAGRELAMVLMKRDVANDWNRLMLRAKYGVTEELLPLVMIKGVGRARARMLWKSKLRSVEEVRKAPIQLLQELLGPRLAKTIKEAKLKEIREEV
jgi:helicase